MPETSLGPRRRAYSETIQCGPSLRIGASWVMEAGENPEYNNYANLHMIL